MLEERSVRVNQVLSGSAIDESLTSLIETRRSAMPACKPSRSASGSRRATCGGGLVPRVRQLPVCDVELSARATRCKRSFAAIPLTSGAEVEVPERGRLKE